MTDIIGRLQGSADHQWRMSGSADEMLDDAITEIKKLRGDVAHLLGELEHREMLIRMYRVRCEHIASLAKIDLDWLQDEQARAATKSTQTKEDGR